MTKTEPLAPTPKHLVQRVLQSLGLQITRVPRTTAPSGAHKYFNTGRLTPLEENSVALYDQFYSDPEALEDYYAGDRIAFYDELSTRLRRAGLMLDGRDVIDVGCGTGHLLSALRSWSQPRSMTGCDFSQTAVQFSRQRFPDCEFFVHDIYQPLPGTFDVVVCTEVLEHLEQPFVGLKNLLDATRPGGIVVVTTPNGRLDTIIEHIHFWSPESWKVFIERECPDCEVTTSTFRNDHNNLAIIIKPSS